jgi:two-component system, NarL family, invasion response regulator UvrY
MKNILLIGELPLIQNSIKEALESTKEYYVTSFSLLNDVQKKDNLQNFDVLLINSVLPDDKIIENIKEIKSLNPNLPVLLYILTHSDQFAIRALKAGVSGYLNYDSESDDFIKAANKVTSGGLYIPSILAEYLALNLKKNSEKKLHETLTNREFQIMSMIAAGKSVSEIAKELYLSKNTVSNHRTHILEKLKLKNNSEITLYAIKNQLLSSN